MTIEELIPFYALGVLNEEELIFVETHLHEHPYLQDELAMMVAVTTAIPLGTDPIMPSAHIKYDLIKQVQMDIQEAESDYPQLYEQPDWSEDNQSSRKPVLATAAVAILAIAAMLIWGVSLYGQWNSQQARLVNLESTLIAQTDQISALESQLNNIETSNQVFAEQLDEQKRYLAIYTDLDSQIIAIKGTDVQPEAIGRLIAQPVNQIAIFTSNHLILLMPNQIYQVWLINETVIVSVGTFSVDDAGVGELIINLPTTYNTFKTISVSIEPAGGSEQPTGEIILSGNL